jgi:hypothetical protein
MRLEPYANYSEIIQILPICLSLREKNQSQGVLSPPKKIAFLVGERSHTHPNNKPLEINARGFIICVSCATAGKFVVLSKLVMPKRLVIG